MYSVGIFFNLSSLFSIDVKIEYHPLFILLSSYTNIYQNQKELVMIDWKMKMIMYHVHVVLNDENMEEYYHQGQIDAFEVYEYILMLLRVLKQ
jgi:radical SAM superfamily enzyme